MTQNKNSILDQLSEGKDANPKNNDYGTPQINIPRAAAIGEIQLAEKVFGQIQGGSKGLVVPLAHGPHADPTES